jgi:PhnB protein
MAKKSKKKAVKKSAKRPAKKAARKPAKKAVKKAAKKPAKKAARKAAPAPVKRTAAVNPYITFTGNCEDAFNHYRSVFGGKFGYLGRFGEMPPQEGQPPMDEATAKLIMHVSLPIGNTILMGSDTDEKFGGPTTVGNNFSVSVNATSKAEADKFYAGLSEGGSPFMPMSKTFWGSYFGMCKDRFGIQWMISYDERPM